MAPDLVLCTSTEEENEEEEEEEELAAESDDDRTRNNRTPNKTSYNNSCTPLRKSIAPSSTAMLYNEDLWSSQNSPLRNSNINGASSVVNPNNPKPGVGVVVPIITPKTREALRHLSFRDQEAMGMELRRPCKVLHATANVENADNSRKLAQEDLNNSNQPRGGARTGSPRGKLRAKLAGTKVMLEEAYNTCELQSIELYHLRRDVSVTHAHELEVERNVYAAEVRRLQEVVKKLKLANGRIGHENRMISRLKAKNHHLEVMNLRLSSCLSASLSQTPRTSRTPKAQQQPQRDAFVRNSFGGFDFIQQQQKNAFHNRLSMAPGACLPK